MEWKVRKNGTIPPKLVNNDFMPNEDLTLEFQALISMQQENSFLVLCQWFVLRVSTSWIWLSLTLRIISGVAIPTHDLVIREGNGEWVFALKLSRKYTHFGFPEILYVHRFYSLSFAYYSCMITYYIHKQVGTNKTSLPCFSNLHDEIWWPLWNLTLIMV